MKHRNSRKRRFNSPQVFGDCPKDGARMFTKDSRPALTHRRRRWECPKCGLRLSTIEINVDIFDRMQKAEADATLLRERMNRFVNE